ncbi:hypothetical protein SEUCBS139899_002476 [Sporothrix eucalyptigena]|uniref:WSC domain-containing protein n=1 Tax=Sporothrix eucalyptigena TaxID=1812306 RepID=A0ABP0B442_9PEZI
MKFTTLLGVTAAGFAASAVAAATTTTKMGVEQPSSTPIYMQPVVQGCFSSSGDLVYNSTQAFNSRGECGQTICQAMGKYVGASTEGSKCYCGDSYPPNSTLVDDKYCNAPCTGFGQDACGGTGYWTVYNTGLELYGVPYANDTTSTTSSSSSSSTSSTTTLAGGQTVFVTQTSDTTAKKSSTNTAGIAAGAVVGVVAVAAAVGAGFFIIRRRRNRQIEEEYRRNQAVNAFFSGGSGKAPSTSGSHSISDSRLDPVMSQRRLSDGSIADNEDYSRRILRVTNA